MSQQIHFSSYTPAADIVVTAICLVMIILVAFSYIGRTRSFKLFVSMVWLLLSAAWADILFYTLAAVPGYEILANWTRCVYVQEDVGDLSAGLQVFKADADRKAEGLSGQKSRIGTVFGPRFAGVRSFSI